MYIPKQKKTKPNQKQPPLSQKMGTIEQIFVPKFNPGPSWKVTFLGKKKTKKTFPTWSKFAVFFLLGTLPRITTLPKTNKPKKNIPPTPPIKSIGH